jgi:hypothetical protein
MIPDIIAPQQKKDAHLKRNEEEIRKVLRENYRNIHSDQL